MRCSADFQPAISRVSNPQKLRKAARHTNFARACRLGSRNVVAQISNLLYRGFPTRRGYESRPLHNFARHADSEVGDTAGWKPALQASRLLAAVLTWWPSFPGRPRRAAPGASPFALECP